MLPGYLQEYNICMREIKHRNGHTSVWEPLIVKIRPLFYSTFKVSGNKVVLFFIWRPTDQVITDMSLNKILSETILISTHC